MGTMRKDEGDAQPFEDDDDDVDDSDSDGFN